MIRLIISFIVAITILQLSLFFGVLFIALAIFAYKIKDKKFDVQQNSNEDSSFYLNSSSAAADGKLFKMGGGDGPGFYI